MSDFWAPEELPWARWFWQRCKAVKESSNVYPGGRCDLKKGHECDHALERGMDTPRWSTQWTLPREDFSDRDAIDI